ncbi:recombinase family protein [Metabacillus litoralis]|uniref:recombinase family protein n=1 Tax=Metabacillus litoralis TaxID=152268 RepID=UPI001E50C711|nr:recombinase family protein [Metabacillus litoralis]UHA60641.1 recombinase family protein [Metabacillus litoralis]
MKQSKIPNILNNKTYTGYIYIRTDSEESGFRKLSEIAHESIISDDIFNECYALHLERKPKRLPNQFYLLNNSVFLCPVCQSSVGVKGGNYICKSKCWKSNISTVNNLVLEFLLEQEKETKEESKLRTAYESLQNKRDQLHLSFARGEISYNQLNNKLHILQHTINMSKLKDIHNRERYKGLIESGSIEQLKHLLINDQIKLTLDEKMNIVQIK